MKPLSAMLIKLFSGTVTESLSGTVTELLSGTITESLSATPLNQPPWALVADADGQWKK